ncbi:SacI homology domain-containing protein [Xylogone sp. PMI_703]|nr:SacI homology domain-containing protein [Xylogone sp. PMI_703]
MSIRVLLREYPHRSIALVTPTHALIFRHIPSAGDLGVNGSYTSLSSIPARGSIDSAAAPRSIVEFSEVSKLDLSEYRTLAPLPVYGTLGLITVNNDTFVCVVAGATKVATVRPGETVEKIFAVDFYCLNSPDYDHSFGDIYDPYNADSQDGNGRREGLEHPCTELQKLLSNGSFYYSTDFDLTNRLQDRAIETSAFDIDNLDESFLWNSFMIGPLVKFRSRLVAHEREALDKSGILTSAIRGFVLTITIPSSSAPVRSARAGLPSSLTLISRLSCRRAGTRFNSRGIDDDGNVANFVETETMYWSPSNTAQYTGDPNSPEKVLGICFSFVQVRGSVPVFWEQSPGLLPGQQKITITRSADGTQPAFDKHFGELEQNYGAIHIVNLLSETKPGEAELTNLYRYGVRHSPLNHRNEKSGSEEDLLTETEFDFHAETKGPGGYEAASYIRRLIQRSADAFAYYLCEVVEGNSGGTNEKLPKTLTLIQQEGVFRTNCLDCLDRTNLIQTIISQMALEAFLHGLGEIAASDFWMRHSSVWADNGDALSRIYAGTGALKSSFTRHGKMSLAGAIADARKSATRLYINNFADKARQNTIDILLGRLVGQMPVHLFDPINDYVTAELNKRSSEFQSSEVINILCATFNLNGRTEGINDDLSPWLCPDVGPTQQYPEIITVGFQEIVELSPQQIMNSDPTRKQAWEKAVLKTLNRHAKEGGQDRYVLLRSGQLVGAALCIFVKTSVLKNIKNVEGSVKKTGLSGMAGNKGAVAIRMDYANTKICFVTAHLAAGFANYEERNRDYATIDHGLRFQRNRGIADHDTVIWMGDFNYRIGLGYEKVKQLISMGDLDTLYENDQLNLQMVAGLAFPYYSESRITFMPTYKFDIGTDTYDTSEKARIPAWTDRILRKGTNLRQIHYNCAPLRFSDHRPVFATFECKVSIINEAVKEALSREIYEKRRQEVGSSTAVAGDESSDDEDLIGYDPIEPGLPPASSVGRKWWLDNGLPAQSTVRAPQPGAVPNPQRPSNPFTPTDEPDWVTIPRMSSTRTNSVASERPPVLPRRSNSQTNLRKLPPPYAQSPSVSSVSKNLSQVSLLDSSPTRSIPQSIDALPPPPPPRPTDNRPSSVLSSSTTSSRKTAPPVAPKPNHLSSPVPSSSPTFSSASLPRKAINGNVNSPASPPRPIKRASTSVGNLQASNATKEFTPPFPPNPRRTGTARKPVANGLQDDEEMKPGLPPRRPTDLLGDDSEKMEMSGWEALQPVK